MGTPHKHAELIKAWADGAQIQCKNVSSKWRDVSPSWDEDAEYRIKPEPKPDVVMYVGMDFQKGGPNTYITREEYCVGHCPYVLKVILDGETGKPKAAEVLK